MVSDADWADYPYLIGYCEVMATIEPADERLAIARADQAPSDCVYKAESDWVRFYALFPNLRDRILAIIDSHWGRV